MSQDVFRSHWFGVAKPGRADFGQIVFESSNVMDGIVGLAEKIIGTPFHDGFVMAIGSTEDIVRKRLAKHQRASRSDMVAQLSAKLSRLASPADPTTGLNNVMVEISPDHANQVLARMPACEAKDLPSAILSDKNPDATSDEIDAMIEAAIREAD